MKRNPLGLTVKWSEWPAGKERKRKQKGKMRKKQIAQCVMAGVILNQNQVSQKFTFKVITVSTAPT